MKKMVKKSQEVMPPSTKTTILSLSDVHLYHQRVFSDQIYQNLHDYFFPKLPTADVVFLIGDWFDSAVLVANGAGMMALEATVSFLVELDNQGVPLIVLRGTWGHDRIQTELFPKLSKRLGLKTPVYYFDKISVAEIPEVSYRGRSLRIGLFPDDLPVSSSEEALEILKGLMSDRGWDTLDYVLLHGYFDEVFPANVPQKPKVLFRNDQFDFVTGMVLCGHDHFHYHRGKVAYNGSFERLNHGDEGAKGFLMVEDSGESQVVTFVENRGATTFKTWDLSHLDNEDALIVFTSNVEELDPSRYHHIRVVHSSSEVKQALMRYVTKEVPHIRLTTKSPKEKENHDYNPLASMADISTLAIMEPITEERLPSAIVDYLGEACPLSAEDVDALLKEATG